MQIGGSWLVRKGHCSECSVGRDKQGWQGLCVSHSSEQASDQRQSWLHSTVREQEGEMGRGAQLWLGAEEQPAWTTFSVRDQLQTFCFSVLPDSSLQPPLALSASQPCSLQTCLSFLFYSDLTIPPPQGLRHLLPSCNVCSSCSSVPFSPIK